MSKSPSDPSLYLLWIDPEADSVAAQIRQLEEHGWLVDYVQTGAEALERAERIAYDVVITDLMLVDALGSDVLYEIHQRRPSTMGIITTNSASLRALVNPERPGTLAYLLKPLLVETIIQIITESLAHELSQAAPLVDAPVITPVQGWQQSAVVPPPMPLEPDEPLSLADHLTRFLAGLKPWNLGLRLGLDTLEPRIARGAVLAAGLLLVIVALGGWGLMAGQRAVMGDALYPLRLGTESMQLAFAGDAMGRAQLHLTYAAERLDEIKILIGRGQGDKAQQAAVDYEREVNLTLLELDRALLERPQDGMRLAAQVRNALAQYRVALEGLSQIAPPPVANRLAGAITFSENSLSTTDHLATTLGSPAAAPTFQGATATRAPTAITKAEPTADSQGSAGDTAGAAAPVAPSVTAQATDTSTPGATAPPQGTPTDTATLPAAATPTNTLAPTFTPVPANIINPSPTLTSTLTPVPTDTDTPRPSDTPKPVNTIKPTNTPRPGNTPKPTNTPKPSNTPKPGQHDQQDKDKAGLVQPSLPDAAGPAVAGAAGRAGATAPGPMAPVDFVDDLWIQFTRFLASITTQMRLEIGP